MRLDEDARTRVADLSSLPLAVGGQGNAPPSSMPLSQIAKIDASLGPAIISHLDRDKVVNVEANTQGRALSEVTKDMDAKVAALVRNKPAGVTISSGGEAENQTKVFIPILLSLGIAIMLMPSGRARETACRSAKHSLRPALFVCVRSS